MTHRQMSSSVVIKGMVNNDPQYYLALVPTVDDFTFIHCFAPETGGCVLKAALGLRKRWRDATRAALKCRSE